MNLWIHSNIRDYEVVFEQKESFVDSLSRMEQSCFVIDENVWRIYHPTLLKDFSADQVVILPIHENKKNLVTVQELYDHLVNYPAKRNLTMVSIGGGILQDVTGYTASTIYRGIRWIYVPTTLLAQADSCIGSKTSLNYLNYKNLIGTFYPPASIHIYTPFLQTLQESDFYSGFGEVIKLHLMAGQESYRSLVELTPRILRREPAALTESIQKSLDTKLSYMAGDEFDTGRRNLLNFGHDFGHAIESVSDFAIPHGQAVVFGMIAANIIASQRGLLDKTIEQEIAEISLFPNLMVQPHPDFLKANAIIDAMKKDKKRTGNNMALIMMDSSFVFSRVNDLTGDEVALTLKEIKTRLGY